MKYCQFKDLPVWHQPHKAIENNGKLRSDYSLTDQLKRSSYSIMLNIAEGFERGSNKEFANFINISKGSAGEVRSILYILMDNRYITKESFKKLKELVIEISANLANFRKYLLQHSEYKK